jgi:hypothetical protein
VSLSAALRAGVPPASCAACAHFRSDPRELEARIPGLRSFGSGFAAVRADDGLCMLHGRYLASSSHCARFAARVNEGAQRRAV